jgi:EAL domain-containing protein (putative c-di-GMP-specific phosphodiesterase class I)
MLRDADIAMYRAKAKGKAQYQVFDQTMREQALTHMRIETEMRQGIEREEFLVYYQPILNLETDALSGFEALVRWKHKTHGILSPLQFIGPAEENGLILPLGKWVLHESCQQLQDWQKRNPAASDLTVSVNLSSKQFLQSDLAEQISEILKETGLSPHCLKLEITESHIMENIVMTAQTITKLRAIGIELSIDDFGTGYSSLSYLHSLPVSYLKIDRSFIARMIEGEENSEIVHTIIKLAQNLKMKVIAEGIETNQQLAQLKGLNCEYGQGYIFAQPMKSQAAETFIAKSL